MSSEMSVDNHDDYEVDYEVLQNNLSMLKRRILPCVVNSTESLSKKTVPVFYVNHGNANDQQQVRAVRNLHGKEFCGVTCLYAIALNLLSQNKNKFMFPSQVTSFEDKINYCIDEVNKTMISQAGRFLISIKYVATFC